LKPPSKPFPGEEGFGRRKKRGKFFPLSGMDCKKDPKTEDEERKGEGEPYEERASSIPKRR